MNKIYSVKVLLEHLIERPVFEEVVLEIKGSYEDIDKKVMEYVQLLNKNGEVVRLTEIENYSEPIPALDCIGVKEVYSEYL